MNADKNAITPRHLSEEDLGDVLIGLASIESEAHLSVCSLCQAKVHAFRTDLNLFNQASLAWSRSRTEYLPPIKRTAKPRGSSPWTALAPVEWALAVAVLLLVGLPVWNRTQHQAPEASVVAASAQPDSETQIAADNDLLKSIDSALRADDPSLGAGYGLAQEPRAASQLRPRSRKP